VPSGPPVARRIEHRIAGGDINPYLMLAVVLGAALAGIEDANEPPAPITGNAYALDLPQTPETWAEAIARFENAYALDLPQTPETWAEAIARFESDPWIKRLLPEGLIQNLLLTKKQELTDVSELTDAERMDLYLDTV